MKHWSERSKKQKGGILAAAALLAAAAFLGGAALLGAGAEQAAPLDALADIIPLGTEPAEPYTGTIHLLVAGYDRSAELAEEAPAPAGAEADGTAAAQQEVAAAQPEAASGESTSAGLTDLIWYVQWDCDHNIAEVIQISPYLYVGTDIESPTGRINAIAGTDAGLDGLCAAVTQLTGLPIDGYVAMDLDGLGDIVEHIGGVEVTLPQDLDDGSGSYLPAGTHLLGRESVEFLVRARRMYTNGELGREEMLRRLFAGLMQYAQTCTLTDAAKLAPVVAKHLQTNVELSTLISLAGSLESLTPDNVTFSIPGCYSGMVGGSNVVLWDPEIMSQLFNVRLGTWYTPEDLNLPEFDKNDPEFAPQSYYTEGSTRHLDQLDG